MKGKYKLLLAGLGLFLFGQVLVLGSNHTNTAIKGIKTSIPTITNVPTVKPTIMPTKIPTPTLTSTVTPKPTVTPLTTVYIAPTQDTSQYTQPTSTTQQGLSNDNYYTNSQGNTVHSPAYSNNGSVPAGATAKCADGTYSFSQSHSGTCSHHGGVTQWL